MKALVRDGVKLCYEQRDGRAPPIVLIHGWCCDHGYFTPQSEHFAARGHGVVAVDLRGHGQSDKPRQSYTMEAFADDVLWVCEQLALTKPVLIGHSMGGIVAFDLAARHPDFASALVMLDSAIAFPAAARAAIPAFLAALRGPDYRAVLRDYVDRSLLLATDDRDRKTWILDAMTSAPQHVMVSAFEGLRDYDADVAEGVKLPPSLYIAANEPVPRSDMTRLHELIPALHFGQTVGSGHFCQLEVPEQVNAMIDRFLAVEIASGLR
jgi:pimeloyl-ACP methyl ester carboxylesterase